MLRKALVIAALLVAGGLVLVGLPRPSPNPPTSGAAAVSAALYDAIHHAPAYAQLPQIDIGTGLSVPDIAERALPSVVNIASKKTVKAEDASPFMRDPFFREFFRSPFFEAPPEREMASLGSGVIVSGDGIVLTNNHVVEKADKVRVTTSDKREFDAEIVGADPKSDLAVLRLKGDLKGLRPLPFGDSAALRLGETVLAIGNPFGVGQTVTMGIVSAKGRANVGIVDYEDFIQTDAAINPGNSGGALLNGRGELVGINTAILSRSGGYQGIGFAIPSNMARPIMESLVKNGRVVRGWLGVVIQNVDRDLAEALNLAGTAGVLVSDVTPDGPAAKAGIQRGDVIVKIAGETVDSTGQLRNIVAARGVGTVVKVEVRRGKVPLTFDVALREMSAKIAGATTLSDEDGALSGLTLTPLDADLRDKLDVPRGVPGGLVVKAIDRKSPAAHSGLRPGDLILEVNRVPVDSLERFREVYGRAGARLLLLVYRGGATLFLLMNK